MEKYKWDLKELRKLKTDFIYEACTNPNGERQAIIQSNIQTLSSMIYQYNFQSYISTFLNDLFHKINPTFNIKKYKEYKNFFSTPFQIDTIFYNNTLLKNYDDLITSFEEIKLKIPFEKQLELTKENYLSIYGLKEDFDFIFDPNNNRIYLSKNSNNNFMYSIDDLVYLMIYYSNKIDTYNSLNHETGHFYEQIMLGKLEYNYNPRLYSYSEISSIFLELIGPKKLLDNKLITEDDFKNIHLQLMATNLKIYNFMRALYISTDENPSLISKIKMFGYEDVFDELHYHFSYIVALNLYYQFLQNPKDAVNNLKYILTNIKEENEKQILKDADIDLSGKCLEKHIQKQMRNN